MIERPYVYRDDPVHNRHLKVATIQETPDASTSSSTKRCRAREEEETPYRPPRRRTYELRKEG
jgi:hypothetical protein